MKRLLLRVLQFANPKKDPLTSCGSCGKGNEPWRTSCISCGAAL